MTSQLHIYFHADNINHDVVKTKICKWNDKTYKILHLNESEDAQLIHNYKQYRSVIFDENGKLLCVSPFMEMDYNTLMDSSAENEVQVEAMVEGTMINLFYDESVGSWLLATKCAIGAEYWYYRTEYFNEKPNQKTFAQMFKECFTNGVENTYDEFISVLNKKYCYSFIMQHPDNHIVLPIQQPTVYIAAIYCIEGNDAVCINHYEHDVNLSVHGVKYPYCFNKHIEIPARELMKDLTANLCNPLYGNWAFAGFMLTNKRTGDRAIYMNPNYENVKKLRGNNPNLQYEYFCLLRAKQITRFLTYFPQYKELFDAFKNQYYDFVNTVHQAYFEYYVKKSGTPIAKKYFIHVSRIHHQVYLPSVAKGNKKIISKSEVFAYFDTLSESDLLFALNYDARQITSTNGIPPEKDASVNPLENIV